MVIKDSVEAKASWSAAFCNVLSLCSIPSIASPIPSSSYHYHSRFCTPSNASTHDMKLWLSYLQGRKCSDCTKDEASETGSSPDASSGCWNDRRTRCARSWDEAGAKAGASVRRHCTCTVGQSGRDRGWTSSETNRLCGSAASSDSVRCDCHLRHGDSRD